MFVFKSLNGLAPSYISVLLCPHISSKSARSANKLLLKVLKSRLESRGDGAFSVKGPTLWNKLPLHIRLTTSLPVFKTDV